MNKRQLEEGVKALGPWFHKIELPYGVTTKTASYAGEDPDHPIPTWTHIFPALPESLEGKTVLDVGCNGGFYSIEALRRGASRVLGVDARQWHVRQSRFAIAALGLTNVCFRRASLYDLSPATVGTYDVVLALGLIYHLKHIFQGLETLFAITDDLLVIETAIVPPGMRLQVAKNRYGYDRKPYYPLVVIENEADHSEPSCNWFIPTASAVCGMLRSVGFEAVQIVHTSDSRGIFLARKPKVMRDSQNPNGLKADIRVDVIEPIEVRSEESVCLNVKCTNIGQNIWLSAEAENQRGSVYLYGHLTQLDDPVSEIFVPWSAIEQKVYPGESVSLVVNFPAPQVTGIYELELDLIANQIGLFQEFGSTPVSLEIQVTKTNSL